jgi:hypothetical protein
MSGAANQKLLWEERAAAARLAQMRGKPAYRTAPPMQHALRRALGPLLKEAGPAPDTLASRWAEIVGERLAKVSEPIRVQSAKGGATLHIRAPSAAAPMIQHAADHIMESVGRATGSTIKTIRITQTAAAPKAPAQKAGPTPRHLSADERSKLSANLAPVQTPAVKTALEKLGEAVLSWRS